MTTLIECRDLYAGYRGAPVVRGLDIHVEEGEIVALLGANGAGKTTTLSTLAGLLPPISGEVLVMGEAVRGGQAHRIARRGVALVPEDRSLFYDLTVRENLRLGRRGRRDSSSDVLDYFPQLRERLDVKAGQTSGGEQQMLAVGRALLGEPKVLMIDEMSLGLAPLLVRQLFPMLRRIVDDTGAGVLLVEQQVDLALEVADRAYVMSHGDLVQEAAAAELAQNRALLEASYLGEVYVAEHDAAT